MAIFVTHLSVERVDNLGHLLCN